MDMKVASLPSLPRVSSAAARLLPIATVVLAAIVAVLPLRFPGYADLTPAFVLMAVYHWSIYRPDLLPPSGLFLVGLAQDLLTGATVGAGALILLLARSAVLRYRRYFLNRSFPFVWSGFALLAAAAILGLWALNCLLELTPLDPHPSVFRTALSIAIFPVASFLLGRTQRAVMGAAA
jgi:rod shape-determining protein MreD